MRAFLTSLCVLLLLTAVLPSVAPQVPLEHTPREPILIDGNSDLTPENGVTRGSGSDVDPYVIEGWLISARVYPMSTGAIRLHNVSAHVVVQDNVLSAVLPGDDGGGRAIWIESSANVTIHDNQIEASNNGILVRRSSDVTVGSNTVRGHVLPLLIWAVSGIVTLESQRVWIGNNTVLDYANGISAQLRSSDVTIERNVVSGGGYFGAIDVYQSREILIRDNALRGGKIQISSSHDIRVEDNQVKRNGIYIGGSWRGQPSSGIVVADNHLSGAYLGLDIDCTDCEVTRNLVSGGEHYGGLKGGPGPLNVHNNTFQGSAKGFAWIGYNVTAQYNNFIDPPTPVIRSAPPTDFRFNWWGDASGPTDGMLAENVQYEPWLTEPSAGAPTH